MAGIMKREGEGREVMIRVCLGLFVWLKTAGQNAFRARHRVHLSLVEEGNFGYSPVPVKDGEHSKQELELQRYLPEVSHKRC